MAPVCELIFAVFIVVYVSCTNHTNQTDDDQNNNKYDQWIIECEPNGNKTKKIITDIDICFNEFTQWLTILRSAYDIAIDTTTPMPSPRNLCPSSWIWRNLTECTCTKCRNSFYPPPDLTILWTQHQCDTLNITATTNLCQWVLDTTHIAASQPLYDVEGTDLQQLTLQTLEEKISELLADCPQYKTMPTTQNMREFVKSFHAIIGNLIELHITANDRVLQQWQQNVTRTVAKHANLSLLVIEEEKAILDGMQKIESTEQTLIEDLKILQQLENHFSIPRAEKQSKEIYEQFQKMVSDLEELRDRHLGEKEEKNWRLFWEKGVEKLQMATHILALISSETQDINRKMDQDTLILKSVISVEKIIEHDLNNEQHPLLLKEENEFTDIIQTMSTFSKSPSFQKVVERFENLADEWKRCMAELMEVIHGVERKLSAALKHVRTHNTSKQFVLGEDMFYSPPPAPKIDIDDLFKRAWQDEMAERQVNISEAALKYDDSSDDKEEELNISGSTELMSARLIMYVWTVIFGTAVFMLSFFMYLR